MSGAGFLLPVRASPAPARLIGCGERGDVTAATFAADSPGGPVT